MKTYSFPWILAIDTSCDETSAAVTNGLKIFSNVVWSQASQHAKFGGVMPSLAQRMHEERIDWVIQRALTISGKNLDQIEAMAVTSGPGLAIALGVGIKKAQEIAKKLKIPLIEINHIEGHLLSSIVGKPLIKFPAFGLVVSGGHTELVYVEKIGKYEIVASTQDDALGEALDKAARMLSLGYPGGAFLEKLAKEGNPHSYTFPLPMAGRENLNKLSYSGLKTAMWRITEEISNSNKQMTRQITCDLAAGFQNMAFKHLIRVITNTINNNTDTKFGNSFLVGGGVAANIELRKRLRKMAKVLKLVPYFPINKKMCGDNAGMIGIAAGFKYQRGDYLKGVEIDKADRKPRWRVDEI